MTAFTRTVFRTHKALQAAMDNGAFLFKPEYGPAFFECSVCHEEKPLNTDGSGGTGYARDDKDNLICYECTADLDRVDMVKTGRAVLYLSGEYVTNWPGTLKFKTTGGRVGRHNMAGVRYDVDFIGPDGHWWHATQYGDNTQIAHCRRTKHLAARGAA